MMLRKLALHGGFVFLILFLNYSDRYVTAAVEPVVSMAAPSQPVPLSPPSDATGVAQDATLSARVSDPEGDTLSVSFYGRRKSNTAGPNFTLAVIPDTQIYTIMEDGAAYFNAQTQWIADHQATNNIVFATHLGDITENGDYNTDLTQWVMANNAISILERNTTDPADDVPYSLTLGNHDTTHYFNRFDQYFGPERYAGRPYYGGHYGTTNHSSYSFFSAAGMKFLMINLKYYEINEEQPAYPAEILEWADDLLKDDLSRRGIVVLHDMIDFVDHGVGRFSPVGQMIYDALKDNPNLFLILSGHYIEGRRTDDGTDGHDIHTLMSNYQDLENGGDGWMRLMEFQPANNQIQVKTFSPTRNAGAGDYQTDDDSQFTLDHQMLSPDFTLIDTVSVASGSDASVPWSGLWDNTEYEWYAAARDASTITVGPVQSFTTVNIPNHQPVLAPIGTQQVQMSGQLSFTASATDIDVPPDPLTYSLNGCGMLSGASIHPTTGVFNWKPVVGLNDLGEYSCPVCVSDGMGGDNVCESVRIHLSGTLFIPSVVK